MSSIRLDVMIRHWRKREAHWNALGHPEMAARARRYAEALERMRDLELSR